MNLLDSYSKIGQRYSVSAGHTVNRWTLMFPGAGCEYYKKTKGGCTMCGFYKANISYSFGCVYPDFVFKTLFRLAKIATNRWHPEELFVYNGGSFLNAREIPETFMKYLLMAVKKHPTLNRIMLESRIEYLNPKNIKAATDILGEKKLIIGIGLESKNSHVRNDLINKGLSITGFEKTIRMIKNSGAQVLAYVFLKPLGLSEEEASEDAWQTISYCRSLEIDEIELSCAFIQAGTKMAEDYEKGEYSPPQLWTIAEIIKKAKKSGLVISIGSFDDKPPPIAIPRNECPDNCSDLIYPLIEEYRRTGCFYSSKLPRCSCRKNYPEG